MTTSVPEDSDAFLSRDEVDKAFGMRKEVWKTEYEFASQYLKSALGGVLLIVATVGFNLEKIAALGVWGKVIVGVTLVLLLIASGCANYTIKGYKNALLYASMYQFLLYENATTKVRKEEMEDVEANFVAKTSGAHNALLLAHCCLISGILMGACGFCALLFVV